MKCEKCGKEIAEGANLCSSCKSDLEESNKEKPMIPPMGIFGWAAATAYGMPAVATSVAGKDKKISNVVSAAEAANNTVTASSLVGATAYGIPSVRVGTAVGLAAIAAATAAGATSIPCPEGAARTLYGMPPISSRSFEYRDYEIVKDTKLCNHCNAKIKLDDKVCPQCGKKLGFAALSEIEEEYK